MKRILSTLFLFISLIGGIHVQVSAQEKALNITEATKYYILHEQTNKPEIKQLNWDERFLDQVDMEKVYQDFLETGGLEGDIENFAEYLTLNAPVNKDWKELTQTSVYEKYGYKIVKFKHLEDDLYQAYVKIDGKKVPYVVVNARTGYYHG